MSDPVIVIGSGPAGLATAAELVARDVPVTVLERGPDPASAWARRYDSLRFNTSRRLSALPGAPFPRSFGQFPTRDQYVSYLRDYARTRGVPVRTGVEVTQVRPGTATRWTLATPAGDIGADQVVVATGLYSRPVLPAWATAGDFGGEVLHSSDYRNPGPFRGRRVLVVGAGSTGLEIAGELARGGAAEVMLSVRRPPVILYRRLGGLPVDLPVPLFLRLPPAAVDRMLLRLQRLVVGDLTAYGIDAPQEGPLTALMRRGAGTAIVDREVVDAVREGLVRVVPAVQGLERDGARLTNGRLLPVGAVVAATGLDTGLRPLVGDLDVLDERGVPRDGTGAEVLPGLRFVGYVYRPGLTGYAGVLARRVAREIAATRIRQPQAA